MLQINRVSNAWDGYSYVQDTKQLYSLHKLAFKLVMPIPNRNYPFIMGIKVRRNNRMEKSLLQKDKENTRSKTEMVPVQIITQDFSKQYCAKRNGHCIRCSVQFL